MHKNIKINSNICHFCPVVLLICLLILSGFLSGCGTRDEKDVVNYVSDLGKKDFILRMGAANFLSQEAKETDVIAVPYLEITLQDPRDEIRRYSAQALGRIKDYSSIPALIDGLKQENDEVRYDCILALGSFQDPRVNTAIIGTVNDDSSYVRWASLETLGKLKVPEAYPQLVAGLKDSSSYARSAAAKALGKLGNKEAIPQLRSSIYNSNLWVRNAAALALSRLGDKEGIPILIMNLGSTARDKKGTVREQAADFLREISGENFGFNASATTPKQKAAIKRWEKWWEREK
jgi:HEAT repeat protein